MATVRRHYKGKEYVTHLLRHSYREGSKVKNRTLANLSYLPDQVIDVIRRALRGETLVGAGERFVIERALPHGHVAAVATAARRLGVPGLLGHDCPERTVALGLVVALVCRPGELLSTTGWWGDTTLPGDLGLTEVAADDVSAAMGWLARRQYRIERRLTDRHLVSGRPGYLHVSSSWQDGRFYPRCSPRRRQRGRTRISLGLVADSEGRPLAIEVLPGNLGDQTAFAGAVDNVRRRLGLSGVILVGDGSVITTARIRALSETEGVGWIIAPPAPTVRALVGRGVVKPAGLDEGGLAEVPHPDHPGERLVMFARSGPARRPRQGRALMAATEAELGLRNLAGGGAVQDEVCVVRTSAPAETLDAAGVVAAYGNLGFLEQDLRSLPAVAFELHPASGRFEHQVRAGGIFCMLAAYVACYLRRIWSPIFSDQHDSLGILLDHLATLTRVRIVFDENRLTVDKLAEATDIQRRAFELLDSPIPLTVPWRP
ncbi:MAG: hypothetical protein M3O70_03025 [Actinomycetota bacterium]|nr:hypothetical protein [Actinomycetota bacterium]